MINPRILFLIAFLFVAYSQTYAQVGDKKENRSIKIPAKETKEKDTIPSELKIKPSSDSPSLTKTDDNINGIPLKSKVEIREMKNEFSMIDNSTLINPGTIYEQRWNKAAADTGIKPEAMSDQFLGDYKSNGKFVNIMCRDHEYPDGDMVRVFVNDEIVVPRLVLTSNYKSFDIPLVEGFNRIVFLALNQGQSGPNTAEFKVFDDNGTLVSAKEWNLLTGVKASIIVIKETP
ncbi:hypothetical protein [Mangrovimonas sp. YM274]|uniref:hypothetical protein n=1 Tax=Mangrovimonas sp. YM274 TaxID=3070660 RepID=UPI0027DD49E9|nr:hypothetical protein [Mangrovimonas sp. YM274]WMI67358.1 hypothetical protein RBH95_09375 [Mangrovimonas sp. YM274]